MDTFMNAMRTRPWLFAGLLSLALLIGNIIASPDFINPAHWPQQLLTMSPLVLVAFANTPAVLSGSGGLDLSMGPLAVACNVILVHILLRHGFGNVIVAIVILVLFGAAIGAINGALVTFLRYQPVIATLCMAFILIGFNLNVGATPHPSGDNWTHDIGGKILGPLPGALVLMAIPAVVWFILSRTSFHRNLYAVGGNAITAYASGVNVHATRIAAYSLGGAFAAFGGVALTALVQSSQATSSNFYILAGITAVALGGNSLAGGRGGLLCTFFGALTLYLLQTFLSAAGVPPTWLNVVYGLMLVVGVTVGARATMFKPNPDRAPKAAAGASA